MPAPKGVAAPGAGLTQNSRTDRIESARIFRRCRADTNAVGPDGALSEPGSAAPVADTTPRLSFVGATYIRNAARCVHRASIDSAFESQESMRVAFIEEMYVKSYSYAIINKVAFGFSLLLGLLVVTWPMLSSITAERRKDHEKHIEALKEKAQALTLSEDPEGARAIEQEMETLELQRRRGVVGWMRMVLGSASSQTSVTALAALSFALYSHFKQQQSQTENLMRFVLFAEQMDDETVNSVVAQMADMDRGFRFNDIIASGEQQVAFGRPPRSEEKVDDPGLDDAD